MKMKFDFKLYLMLGLVMTFAVIITGYAQDMFLTDAVGSGDVVIGGFGIPILYGFVVAAVFMILWKYLLKKNV